MGIYSMIKGAKSVRRRPRCLVKRLSTTGFAVLPARELSVSHPGCKDSAIRSEDDLPERLGKGGRSARGLRQVEYRVIKPQRRRDIARVADQIDAFHPGHQIIADQQSIERPSAARRAQPPESACSTV